MGNAERLILLHTRCVTQEASGPRSSHLQDGMLMELHRARPSKATETFNKGRSIKPPAPACLSKQGWEPSYLCGGSYPPEP